MRDTCGLLIAGQGAARGDRRATGDEQGARDLGRQTRFAVVAIGRSVSASGRYLWRRQRPAAESSLAANLN